MVGHRPAGIFFYPIKALPAPAVVRGEGDIGCCPGGALPGESPLVYRQLFITIDGSLKLVGIRVKLRVSVIDGAQINGGIIAAIEIRSRLVGIIPQITIHIAQINIYFAVAVANAHVGISR